MTIIQRIQFSDNKNLQELYARDLPASLVGKPFWPCVLLKKRETLSFNSFVNSFYEYSYSKHTTLGDLYYLLNIEGDFTFSVFREVLGKRSELLKQHVIKNSILGKNVRIDIRIADQGAAGRIYFELTCNGQEGKFCGGSLVTDKHPKYTVSLGIIIPTYKRENHLMRLVRTILSDPDLNEQKFSIYIIDSGRTLSGNDLNNERINLFYNKNAGGAGGYARGLIEAGKENVHSHFLCLEDDVDIDTEAILRLFPIYGYAKNDISIFGESLDILTDRYMNHDGVWYRQPDKLTFLMRRSRPFENAFYFFSFSRSVLNNIGFPYPFFSQGDDNDYFHRIREDAKTEIVSWRGLAVWHEFSIMGRPYRAKIERNWIIYYSVRNDLVVNAFYYNKYFGFKKALFLVCKVMAYVFVNHIQSTYFMLKGIEDYLKGPQILRNNDPEVFQRNLQGLFKGLPEGSAVTLKEFAALNWTQKIRRIVFAVNRLLPPRTFIVAKILFKLSILLFRFIFLGKSIEKQWRNSRVGMSKKDFWEKYLSLKR